MTSLATTEEPLDTLRPLERNPRRGDLAAIRESLREHGQYQPIVVRRATREILAGNHRYLAAKAEGWETIAVVLLDVDDETAARIALVDNRTSDTASYDDALLADLLRELAETETGLAGTGYDDDALAALLKDVDIDSFGLDVEPTDGSGQPDLTVRKKLVCPSCGAAFEEKEGIAAVDGDRKVGAILPPKGTEARIYADRIRDNLTPDLLKPAYRKKAEGKPRSFGHCYVASETLWHLLGGEASSFRPARTKHEDSTHWWLVDPTGTIYDLTGDQFEEPVPYEQGVRATFLTKEPSKRARELIGRVER